MSASDVSLGTETAHAKLTVHLHMTGVRDDGYHLIDAEMVSLDLADTLEFYAGDELTVVGDATGSVPTTADNLVSRALRLAGRTAAVRLIKRIPAGGGLGGGSSDAAAVLRWAGVVDPMVAASIGADVPFCLAGGRAMVAGVGELLSPLPDVSRTYTLLVPSFGVDTASVYRAYDSLGGGVCAAHNADNHLEAAALVVEPRLASWRDSFAEVAGVQPTLAGSGATWFAQGAHDLSSLCIDRTSGASNGARTFIASTVGRVLPK